MKTALRLMLASILFVGTVSLVKAQSPEVTHNTWTSGAPMPTAVTFAAAAVLKAEIYVVGGENTDNTIIADTQIYDPATNAWSTGVSYPAGIASASAAVVKNVLYVFGGTSDRETPSNAVWAYSPKTKTWSAKAAMPTARWSTAVVVEKNIIYVVGGTINASPTFTAAVESYNPATNTWTEEAPLLVVKSQPAAGLQGTAKTGYTIVVADGATNGGGDTGDNEGYDATTNTWTSLASDPASRYASCFGSVGAKFYDMGGTTAETFADDFQLSKDKWTTTLASVPQSVLFPASAVYKGQLYCIGGWSSFGGPIIDNVQIYQP
ncbi:MAG TPA: kelch repeat-containing protein [Terriglobales bacterium]